MSGISDLNKILSKYQGGSNEPEPTLFEVVIAGLLAGAVLLALSVLVVMVGQLLAKVFGWQSWPIGIEAAIASVLTITAFLYVRLRG